MLSKEETIKLASLKAEQGFLCSESVLIALSECQGVESPLIPRLATGFGAGSGRRGELCGALSGSIMGLGIRFGRNEAESFQSSRGKRRPYWYSSVLMDRFRECFGCVRCMDLLGLDLTKREGSDEYYKRNLWGTKCREYIMTAVEIAHEILLSE